MQIIFNARETDDYFIIIHNFIWQHQILRLQDSKTLTYIYLISVSINRMLISQLKRFLGVKFMFPSRFIVNLAFISNFYAVVIRIITFQSHDAAMMRSLLLLQ